MACLGCRPPRTTRGLHKGLPTQPLRESPSLWRIAPDILTYLRHAVCQIFSLTLHGRHASQAGCTNIRTSKT